LETFDSDMKSVTDASYMFCGCKSLKTSPPTKTIGDIS